MLPTELWYLAGTHEARPMPARFKQIDRQPRRSIRRRVGMTLITLGMVLVDERRRPVVLPSGR